MNQQPTCIDCGRTVHDGADTTLILLGGAWKCEGACPCPECGKPLALETGHPASQDDPGQEPRLFCESCGHQQTAPGVDVPAANTKPASEPVQDAASVEGLMEDARVDWLLSPQCKISPKRQLQEAQLIQQVWDAAIRAYAQWLKEGR